MKAINSFWLKIGFVAMALIGGYEGLKCFIQEPWFGIRQNVSDSLPYTVFLSTRLGEIKPYMYVALQHPKSSLLIAKQVIGLPGDRLTIRNQTLSINGIEYGIIRQNTRSGCSINPIQEGVIPQGFVFVYAPHPDSYDSRYAEFGLVAKEQLKEQLWPLF